MKYLIQDDYPFFGTLYPIDLGRRTKVEISSLISQTVHRILTQEPGFTSLVHDPDMARVIGNILEIEVPLNPRRAVFVSGDQLVVARYYPRPHGPYLPEGATELPKGTSMNWLVVKLE